MKRELPRQKMKPIADAPSCAARVASSARVMPQIFTRGRHDDLSSRNAAPGSGIVDQTLTDEERVISGCGQAADVVAAA